MEEINWRFWLLSVQYAAEDIYLYQSCVCIHLSEKQGADESDRLSPRPADAVGGEFVSLEPLQRGKALRSEAFKMRRADAPDWKPCDPSSPARSSVRGLGARWELPRTSTWSQLSWAAWDTKDIRHSETVGDPKMSCLGKYLTWNRSGWRSVSTNCLDFNIDSKNKNHFTTFVQSDN